MNSHHCASRFGKSGGGFKKEIVEKLALLIEAGPNGSGLFLSSSARKPREPSELGSVGKTYEDRMKYDIDASEMS